MAPSPSPWDRQGRAPSRWTRWWACRKAEDTLDVFPRVFVPFCVIIKMKDEGPPGPERLIEDVMGLWRLVRAAAYPPPPHHARLTAEQFWLLR